MRISSRRLRNSGRKCSRTEAMTRSRTSSGLIVTSSRNWEPRLLVRMTTVLRKSTVCPWPSVSRPSSSTCSRALNTSGWAFSTSSSRTTE